MFNRMVVRQSTESAAADALFHALSDATRRDIVARTLFARQSVTSLAQGYPMSFAAVSKHVAVLEKAGLVTRLRQGREHLVAGNPVALRDCRAALDHLELLWRDRVDRMDDLLAADPNA